MSTTANTTCLTCSICGWKAQDKDALGLLFFSYPNLKKHPPAASSRERYRGGSVRKPGGIKMNTSTHQTSSPLLAALKDVGIVMLCVCTVASGIALAVDAGATLINYLRR